MDTNEKKRILLIDDDETQHTIVENMLKGEYEIHNAKSGKEALNFLYSNFIPDLILLDILMPEMDGWEVYNRIKAISILKRVPIVFLTGVTESREEKRAFDMGAADFIKKPYEKEVLLERIKRVLRD